MAKKNWIKSAIKKPGALRRDLGAALDKPISPEKINKAAKGSGKTAQRARLALTLAKLRAKHKVAHKGS